MRTHISIELVHFIFVFVRTLQYSRTPKEHNVCRLNVVNLASEHLLWSACVLSGNRRVGRVAAAAVRSRRTADRILKY